MAQPKKKRIDARRMLRRVNSLERRLAALEEQWRALYAVMKQKIERDAALTNRHMPVQPVMFRGWAAISRYVGLQPSTLRHYKDFPAARLGRHVVTSNATIDVWLLTRERHRRARLEQLKLAKAQFPELAAKLKAAPYQTATSPLQSQKNPMETQQLQRREG